MTKKTAVILFNLGGPDAPESVQPFLFNLFNDKAIIGVKQPIRWLIAKLISTRRAPIAREIYAHLGGKSPLLEQTEAQAKALEEALNFPRSYEEEAAKLVRGENSLADSPPNPPASGGGMIRDPRAETGNGTDYKTFICMRYWHPMSTEVAGQVKEFAPDEIILLPLYPQFSTTTTGSSFADFKAAAKKVSLDAPMVEHCCYPVQEDFIAAQTEVIATAMQQIPTGQPFRLLFSAHGLPEKIIAKGDPYQWQIEQTTQAIMAKLYTQYPTLDAVNCYQSRVGPLEWIKPSTDDEIIRAGKDGVAVVVIPIAFVSEHSETLVELDIEYKELAEQNGVGTYIRVPTLQTHHGYIGALKSLCLSKELINGNVEAHPCRLCPSQFTACPHSNHD